MSDDKVICDALRLERVVSDPGLGELPTGPARELLDELSLYVTRYDDKTYTLVLRGETK